MAKYKSRATRFHEAQDLVEAAKTDMEDLRDELQDWLVNLPANLEGSNKADELQCAIAELEAAISGLDEVAGVAPEFPGMFS